MAEFQQFMAGMMQQQSTLQEAMTGIGKGMEKLLERMEKVETVGVGGGTAAASGGEEWKEKDERNKLNGKEFEMAKVFGGGEAEWQEWALDMRMLVDTRSE